MKSTALAAALAAAILFTGGCKKQQDEKDAIRAGIMQHLSGVGTLNMSAMDMDIKSVSITGDTAHAEVEFRPKSGGAPGAAMQVAYNLEKRDGAWIVQKTQPAGGNIQHPAPGTNPHMNQDVHPGSPSTMPNFNDLVNPPGTAGAPAPGNLPPGHPPVNSQSSGQDQSSTKKPR
jgi:hypothetical protein